MKRFFTLTLTLTLTLCLISCNNEIKNAAGDYSYKASGSVLIDDTLSLNLEDEIGAMTLIQKSQDSLLLTFNVLNGNVYTATGSLCDQVLTLNPFSRSIKANILLYNIQVTGSGEVYEDNIILHLQYHGTSTSERHTLSSTDILLVAKR